jgi:transcriptional regulator with XRE-family HTH domain
LLFLNIDEPKPNEIKEWMKKNDLSIENASEILGISKRQFSRILSGESKAKRLHALAMQMIWILNENKKQIMEKNFIKDSEKKSVKIPIK